jgi:hypothetical protein
VVDDIKKVLENVEALLKATTQHGNREFKVDHHSLAFEERPDAKTGQP